MKNIIKIDISTYIIVLLSLLGGNYKEIIISYLIIIIHEIGHIFFLKVFNKEIISIKLYPFGGITSYNSLINHNLFEELLISIGGIINQLLLFILFFILFKYSFINEYSYQLFLKYNISLMIFNLLPIIGLDGEKIIHIILEYFFSYKLSNILSIIISIISLIIFIIKCITLKINILFLIVFFMYKIIIFIKNLRYYENKFLLERYLYNIPYKKILYIKNINFNKMKQETYHFFNYRKEYDYLKEKYEN